MKLTLNPFYTYKLNDRKWNNCGTYVFKSSQTAAEIGLTMDRTARQTPLRELVAHMDWLHSRVKGFITLTLWVKKSNIIDNTLPYMHGVQE